MFLNIFKLSSRYFELLNIDIDNKKTEVQKLKF